MELANKRRGDTFVEDEQFHDTTFGVVRQTAVLCSFNECVDLALVSDAYLSGAAPTCTTGRLVTQLVARYRTSVWSWGDSSCEQSPGVDSTVPCASLLCDGTVLGLQSCGATLLCVAAVSVSRGASVLYAVRLVSRGATYLCTNAVIHPTWW